MQLGQFTTLFLRAMLLVAQGCACRASLRLCCVSISSSCTICKSLVGTFNVGGSLMLSACAYRLSTDLVCTCSWHLFVHGAQQYDTRSALGTQLLRGDLVANSKSDARAPAACHLRRIGFSSKCDVALDLIVLRERKFATFRS